MRAITLDPSTPNSADLEEMPEPSPAEGSILVDGVALGICGTDAEIVRGEYGEAPPGSDRLILGHESLGRVDAAPDGCGLEPGDLVAGIVRRPDPVPCGPCAAGAWDMCTNGLYTERGITGLDGYGFVRRAFTTKQGMNVMNEIAFCVDRKKAQAATFAAYIARINHYTNDTGAAAFDLVNYQV